MAVENYYTRFSTTVGGGGYTAGSGILNVGTTAGTLANFRVVIVDQTTGAFKALLKVTGVNSGTQYATTTDPGGTDANCAAGDVVYAILSADAMDKVRIDQNQFGAYASLPSTTGQKQGNHYKCTDGPYEFIFDGSLWRPFVPVFGQVTVPVLGNFTAVNGTGTTTDTTSGPITLISNAPGGSVENYHLWVKTQPSTPYTVTALFYPRLFLDNYESVGLIFRESSTGKFVGFLMGFSSVASAAQLILRSSKYSSTSAVAANYLVDSNLVAALGGGPLAIRMTNTGTNLQFFFSIDGQYWVQFDVNHSTTDYMAGGPNQCGFLISGGAKKAMAQLLNWTES